MPTILTNGIQLPDKGSVDWYSSMQSNYNLIDTHLGNTDIHVTTEDKSNWDSKASGSHTHSSTDITDISDYASKQYVDTSISGLIDNAPDALNTLNELSAALNDDSNFASTVTTALGNKANSADLATVATSGSYTDLTDKPSIPTKTSDLNNDSNFVDTSNSAVASGITSTKVTDYDTHIADTNIHVTFADKTSWNGKADDSAVVHVTGNETIAGLKDFIDYITSDGDYLGNEASTNQRTNLLLRSNRDTAGKSGIYITKFRQNRAQGELQPADLQKVGFDVLENETRTNNIFDIQCTNWLNDVPQRVNFVSSAQSYSWGRSTNKALVNDLNPGSLSLPDLNNGIDISGSISTGSSTNDTYTAPADGYLAIIMASSSPCGMYVYDYSKGIFMRSNSITDSTYNNVCGVFIPILKNQTMNIASRVTESIVSAKFYPCQGNI